MGGMLSWWNIVGWQQGEAATTEHAGREISHDRLSLDMQIAHHLIGSPSTEELDAIRIHIGTQEGHGARGTQKAGGDIVGQEAIGGAERGGCETEGGGEVRRCQAPEGV